MDPPPSPQTPEDDASRVKRRRLDAQSTLSKPFRSPLIRKPGGSSTKSAVPAISNPPATPVSNSTDSSPHPAKAAPSTPTPTNLSSTTIFTPTPARATPPPFKLPTPGTATPNRASANRLRGSPLKRPLADPELAAAQKKQASLQQQLRAARGELETAKQAALLEASNEDEELVAQIKKWRGASREAAEELLDVAGDKINRVRREAGGSMFGRGGWNDDDRGGGGSWGWGDDSMGARDGEGDGGNGDEGIGGEDEMAAMKQEEEERKKREAEGKKESGMVFMLKALGVPQQMLGWDAERECWAEMKDR